MANKGTHSWWCYLDPDYDRLRRAYVQTGSTKTEEEINDIKFTLDWEIVDQDVVNGKSTIDWSVKVYLKGFENSKANAIYVTDAFDGATGFVIGNTGRYSSWTDLYLSYRWTIDGVSNGMLDMYEADGIFLEVLIGETKTIASGTSVISHDSDGTKSTYFRLGVNIDDTLLPDTVPIGPSTEHKGYSHDSSFFQTDYVTFDPIAKHGVIKTAPNFNDEQSPTITYAIPAESTEAWVGIALNGSTMTIPYRQVAVTSSSYTFNFTQSEKEALWKILAQGTDTAEARFYIKTTYDGQVIPSYEARTLTIVNYMPTLDTEIYDTNADCINYLTGNKYILVRHISNAYFKTGGKTYKGASIDSQLVKNSGVTLYGATGTFEKVQGTEAGTNFDFTIVDSYGRNYQETMQFDTATGRFVPYVKLTCSADVTPMTGDGDVIVTLTGKYYEGSFGLKSNRMRMSYDLAKNNGDRIHYDKGYIYPTINGTDYTYTFTISGLEYLSVYDLYINVADEVAGGIQGVVPVDVHTILAAQPIFDWSRTDFAFYVPVTINEAAVPSIVEQVLNDNGWSYRKWSDGTAECWRTLSVTTAVSTSTNASWYSSGELSSTNLSFPFTFAARPSVTVQTMPTGSSWCIVFPSNTTGSTTKTGSYQLNSMSSTSSRAHLLSYDVKGRWK